MSLYDNKEELLNTGKIDPVEQIKKAGTGLGQVLSLEDNLFSMKRIDGLMDALSGATRNNSWNRNSDWFTYSFNGS